MDIRTQKLYQAALEANDYRVFLSNIFEASTKEGRKFNFAAFSRKAGFSSRGFVKEILDGRKRLTTLSFPKIIKALALPPALKLYFTYLVIREEAELNHDKLSSQQIEQKIGEAKEKMSLQLAQADNEGPMAKALFKSYQALEVYSALSSSNPGTPVNEVMKRTGYSEEICQNVLDYFVEQKLVTLKQKLYRSVNPHSVFQSVGGNDGIKIVYLDSLSVLKKKAATRFNGPDQHFSQSFFLVPKHKLPELRKRLRETLQEFIETHETDHGDCVAKLLVGLYS